MSLPLNKIQSCLTPVFTPEMGKRMALIRMKRLQPQAELARLLGVKQQHVSAIETGSMVICPGLTLARFVAVFADASNYVLIGTNALKWEQGNPQQKYWKAKHKERAAKRIKTESELYVPRWREFVLIDKNRDKK